jgi:hypothetical protein
MSPIMASVRVGMYEAELSWLNDTRLFLQAYEKARSGRLSPDKIDAYKMKKNEITYNFPSEDSIAMNQ